MAFKETIFGPCRKHRAGTSRQRLNSNTINRHVQHDGDAACLQQRSLLGRGDSPRHHLHLQQQQQGNSSLRRGVPGDKGESSRKHEVKGSSAGAHLEHLASSLCPDILNCNKARTGKAGDDADGGENRSRQDLNELANGGGSSKLIYVHGEKVNKPSALHEEGGRSRQNDKSSSVSIDLTPTCNIESEFEYAGEKYDTGEKYDGNSYSVTGSSDSNCNSAESDGGMQLTESAKRSVDIALQACAQNGKPLGSSASHQRGLARPSGATTSLCKQCLTNVSTAKGISAPCGNGVDAYRVRYNVKKPLTRV